MKDSNLLLISAAAIGLFFFVKSRDNNPGDAPFTGLPYSQDAIDAMDNLYAALTNAIDPLTNAHLNNTQIRLLLSQALVETGLFSDSPNWTLVNGNNFSGIVAHGQFPANENGRFAAYGSINDFVNDWLKILSGGARPLEQTNVFDFNSALKANGYYGSDNSLMYLANLTSYDITLQNLI